MLARRRDEEPDRDGRPSGFGGIQPTDFGGTAASPTSMPAPIAPGDPRRDPNDPWGAKGIQPGTTTSGPGSPGWTDPEPAPTSQVGDYLERFPTPQLAWQDWIKRMGQYLARDPSETPNFPGPWGNVGGSGAAGTPGLTTEEKLRELMGDSPGTDEIIRKMDERGKGTFYGIQAN